MNRPQSVPAPPRSPAITGLATVALLKANYDAGRDHITMFMPFVLDAVAALDRNDFDVVDVRGAVFVRHHLSIPDATLRTLLQRAVQLGAVKREAKRYFRVPEALKGVDITATRERVEGEQRRLGAAFQQFARARRHPIESDEAALELLLRFLADNEIPMLLEERAPVAAAQHARLSARDTRLVARFMNDVCLPDPELGPFLRRALEGLVLQNALLLRDISSAPRRFGNLTIFLDTRLVLRALGFEGDAVKIALREGLDLLRATNARLAVFERTVDEVKRVLAFYEHRLGTVEGQRSLNPTDVARYFMANGYSPAEVQQARALVGEQLRQLGIEIREMPTRDPRYTRDEPALTEALKRRDAPDAVPVEPRVQHDVDCVAGVLTLRGDRTPDSLDDARAVFASVGQVVSTVGAWWGAGSELGIPPIIHYMSLSNAAWLKKPTAATDLKVRELVALCVAALRPSRVLWDQFLQHLRRLEESGDLSTQEAVAVTASALTDRLLGEIDDEDDVDARTLGEVIEHVKTTYRADADQRVAQAEANAAAESEKRRTIELRLSSIADTGARSVAFAAFSPLVILVVIGSFAGLPAAIGLRWLAAIAVAALSVYGLFVDPLRGWRRSMEAWLRPRFRTWLYGRSSD